MIPPLSRMASSALKIPKIWLVVVLMSAALLGIILVQAYWIHNAISLRRTIFNQQVNEAMHAAVRQLERHRAADMLEEHADFLNAEMPFWSAADSSARSPADTGDALAWIEPHPLHLGEAFNAELPDSLENFLPTLPFSLGNTVYDPALTDESEVMSALLRDAENQIVANIRRFSEVFEDLIGELVRGQYANFRRIDPVLLDSLLGAEFRQKGVYTPYAYAVLLGGENLLTSAGDERENEALLSSVHRVQINEFNLFGPPDELYVSFPGEDEFLLRSIWTLLSGSALFTLVIILGFSYTVFALQYQKKLSDIKTDFINNMTHEFKTPIATISLAVDSINNPRIIGDQDRISQYTGIIREENRRMNAQVEKVLQMALLDRNEIKLHRERLDLHTVIQTAVESIELQVEQRQGRISTELRAEKRTVLGDEVHLVNVVRNLIDNANKYSTQEPHIQLETWNDQRGIYLSVTDNGIGMDRETQRRIFEKFYRVPRGNVHDVKGFGLGLSYVKALLDAHGGSITVKSQPGKGSQFTIYLPITT